MKKGVLYCRDNDVFQDKIKEIGINNLGNYIVLMSEYRNSWKQQLEGQEIDPHNCIGIDAANLIRYGAKLESVEPFKMEEVFHVLYKAYRSHGNFDVMEELSNLKNKRVGVDVFMQFKIDMEKYARKAEEKIKERNKLS